MKNNLPSLFSLLLTLACATSAHAIIIGNSAGYLLDHERPFLTARVGGVFYDGLIADHIAELEFGYSSDTVNGIKTQFLPATVNYRGQFGISGPLGGYVGLGAGMARSSVRAFGVTVEDWTGVAQAFAGVSLAVGKSATIDLGARYLRVHDVKEFDYKVAIDDDIAIEAGFHLRF